MDPNAEERSPKVEVADIEVEFQPASQAATSNPPIPLPERLESPSSSKSIFRGAFPRTSRATLPLTPEEQAKRYEEEFQKRLQGEYEAAQRRIGNVVNDNMARPLRLTSVRLSPYPNQTRKSFLDSLLHPFLNPKPTWMPQWLHPGPSNPPTNLHEILLTTRAMVSQLDQFGIWDLDSSSIRLEAVPEGDIDEIQMILGLKPRGRFFMKMGTSVGAGEGSGEITARLRNALGGGETLEAVGSVGTTTKKAYTASLTTPVLASPLLSFGVQAFAQDRDNTFFASHREELQGGRMKLNAICPWGTHDLTYEFVKRDIRHLSPKASVSIRELANPSTKSSLVHTWTSDTRDDPWQGRSGRSLKLVQEYAGLPGSSEGVKFLKTITQSGVSRALYEGSDITYSISSLATFLYPLTSTPTHLPDRTFLGGPNSLRGWKVGGVGPRDGHDSLGGDMSWALGVSALAPIPTKSHWPVKLHGFLNIGKCTAYDRGRGIAENIVKMYRQPNVSAGVGLMLRIDPLRVEFNFGMPLIARKGERLQRGFDLGVGIEFL